MRVPESFRVVEMENAWKPTERDELIYEWVRFGGKSQGWVARTLQLSQGTVSRVVQRYERWLAHTQPQDAGRLDHEERLRVQRILTYERNERILASCLRIAGEMEGFIDVSKSTIRREGFVGAESDVRTEHATLDRSGTAARFLRLAFRVNMEQLKLAELEPLAALPPLAAGEVDDAVVEELGVSVAERSSTPATPDAVKENCDETCNGAHNAHERMTDENVASVCLPVSYESNGSQKKTGTHARMDNTKRPTRVFYGGMPSASGRPSNRLTADVADGADATAGRR